MLYDILPNYDDVSKFNPNNMVVVVRWEEKINLSDAFNLLPVQPIEIEVEESKKKLEIVYYGIEDVIVSIRYKKQSRGIRPTPTQADNFVSIDLQIGGKNVHVKLSSDNALVMGVVSVEKAIEAVECLLDTIYMTDRNLEYFKSCDKGEIYKAFDYIKDLAVDDRKSLDLPDIKLFQDKLKGDGFPVNEKLATLILTRGYETKSLEMFDNILETMLNSSLIANNDICIENYQICNSAYNYKLNITQNGSPIKGCFILKNLAMSVINMGDDNITASHHNWHEKYANVVISTYGLHKGKLLMKKNKKRDQHIHRFNISEGAGIRQWSPSTKEEAFLVHKVLIAILKNIIANNSNVFVVAEE